VDRDFPGGSFVALSLQREVSVPEHHLSDTETVVSSTPRENEALRSTQELPVVTP
ncbi:hypothetical protein A2U01_0093159, partial [Trifolium medium]|nr:hypothetical protein [Trifolium medium]